MFATPKPPSPPPLSAQFQSKLEPAQPGVQPQQHAWSLSRSSDGKMRVDQGNQSTISDPAAGKTLLLNHASKEAMVCPAIPSLPKLNLPAGAALAFSPPQAPINVQDLGKKMLNGVEVQGKLFTFAPPKIPGLPGAPSVAVPGAPKPPGLPGAPSIALPQPHQLELWTSLKLALPLASRTFTELGKQTTIAKVVTPGEPPAAAFQIPAGYKLVPCPHAPASLP